MSAKSRAMKLALIGSLAASGMVAAQTDQPAGGEKAFEDEIIVTGSRIPDFMGRYFWGRLTQTF